MLRWNLVSMLDDYSKLYQEVRQQRQDRYNVALSEGSIEPFVYPWETASAAALLLAAMFIPRLNATHEFKKVLSVSSFVVVVSFCVSTMRRCRTVGMAGGYGIGLMCMWGIVASAYLLVFNDPGTSFRRVERRDVREANGHLQPEANGSATITKTSTTLESPSLRNRQVWGVNGPGPVPVVEKDSKQQDSPYRLVWQGFPEPLAHRLDWTIDLITSFRGVNWNFRIPSLPKVDLPPDDATFPSKPGATPSSSSLSLNALRRRAVRDFIIHYLAIDIIKAITQTDPYFHGTVSLSSPSPWPLLTDHATLTRFTRLLISIASVLSALTFIFSLSPLIFPILPIRVSYSPLHEPLLYPPYWGALAPSVLDKGLPGLWGKWWHQMFRFGISEPSRNLIEKLGLQPKSQTARVLAVIIAFAISGSIHACASFTTFAESRPLMPLAFFMLQAFGVLGQTWFTKQFMHRIYDVKKLPAWLRRAGNGIFVLVWLYFTGPMLADDFARCQIWLFEPFPISPVRAFLGWDWWCWYGPWITIWRGRQGDPWWRKGIAVL